MVAGGSSPLTRGKHSGPGMGAVVEGLIPAHAGKTCLGPPDVGDARAHPRSRGENSMEQSQRKRQAGSSPLTRGKPDLLSINTLRSGLIPAHAGKTLP